MTLALNEPHSPTSRRFNAFSVIVYLAKFVAKDGTGSLGSVAAPIASANINGTVGTTDTADVDATRCCENVNVEEGVERTMVGRKRGKRVARSYETLVVLVRTRPFANSSGLLDI